MGTSAALLNPYIGIFGFFNVVELFILTCFYVNLIAREKKIKKYSGNILLKASVKSFGFAAYFIAVFFFIIKLFVGVSIFILAYTSKEIAVPYRIWSNQDTMSGVCLTVEMIFNVALLISLICKGKSIRRMAKEYE